MICVDFSFSDTHWKSLLNHSQIQWPGDDVWRHRPGSTFFHVMACTLRRITNYTIRDNLH